MEEKILIKSERYNVKKLLYICLIIGIVTAIFLCSGWSADYGRGYEHEKYCDCWACRGLRSGEAGLMLCIYIFAPMAGFSLIGGLIYYWLHSYELTITDKRVFGKVAWGKRVDLPLDLISATATVSFMKGIAISTSSGRICFLMIKNSDEIYKVISSLLVERQNEKNIVPETVVQKSDEADMLKKYKALLDDGTITQEEFEAKKKQLMGL